MKTKELSPGTGTAAKTEIFRPLPADVAVCQTLLDTGAARNPDLHSRRRARLGDRTGLKAYMDNVLVDKNTASPIYIPVLIVAFTTVQGFLNYAATYLNTWVGTRINHDLNGPCLKKTDEL